MMIKYGSLIGELALDNAPGLAANTGAPAVPPFQVPTSASIHYSGMRDAAPALTLFWRSISWG
jgi:hypothetical protein